MDRATKNGGPVSSAESREQGTWQGTWQVATLLVGEISRPVIAGTNITVVFDGDSIRGSGGCNSYQGVYRTDGASIGVGPLISTQAFCDDPAGVSDQEINFLSLLGTVDEFVMSGDELVLRAAGIPVISLRR